MPLCMTSLLWCYIVRIKGSFYAIFILKFCFEPSLYYAREAQNTAAKSKFYEHNFEFISHLDDVKCLLSTIMSYEIPLKDYV